MAGDPEIRGFWRAAQAEPERRALLAPDGRAVTRGELQGACNRVVHGLRAAGLARGDNVATLLPNGAPMLEVLFAVICPRIPTSWPGCSPRTCCASDCDPAATACTSARRPCTTRRRSPSRTSHCTSSTPWC